MMIKPANIQSVKFSVFLKDGTEYLNKDINDNPFGNNDRYVSFWDNNKIILIPMREIARIEMVFEQ